MKPVWVLTAEERKQKFEGRTLRKTSPKIIIGAGVNSSLDKVFSKDLDTIDQYVKFSLFCEPVKVLDMETYLLRQIIRLVALNVVRFLTDPYFSRMVAFRANMSRDAQQQLQAVLHTRCRQFARGLEEMMELTEVDRDKVRTSMDS